MHVLFADFLPTPRRSASPVCGSQINLTAATVGTFGEVSLRHGVSPQVDFSRSSEDYRRHHFFRTFVVLNRRRWIQKMKLETHDHVTDDFSRSFKKSRGYLPCLKWSLQPSQNPIPSIECYFYSFVITI